MLDYVGRYTHRVAISNSRILSISDGKVTFLWKDYADSSKVKPMTLDAVEALRDAAYSTFGEVAVPVPMTSSASTRSGATGRPAASDVHIPCGVRAFEDTLGQSAFEESVQGPPS